MDVKGLSKVRLLPWWLILYPQEKLLLYIEWPHLKEKVIDFIRQFIIENSFIFLKYCSRCGNCCRRQDIVITVLDLPVLVHGLGLTEKEFSSQYLSVASGWSDNNSVIRLKDGMCPFLNIRPSGKSICNVYENRPLGCRLYLPNSPLCKKEIDELIERIEYLDIENRGAITVSLKNGEKYINLSFSEELKSKFREILCLLMSVNNEKIHEFRDLLSHQSNPTAIIQSKVSSVREEYLFHINNFILKEINFYPFSMGLTYIIEDKGYNYLLNYFINEQIIKKVRLLLHGLVKFIKNYHWPEKRPPICYMCGSCCRISSIEVECSHIYTIADNLNISKEEVMEKYMEKSNHSWNPSGGNIKKHIKNGREECIFLEERKNGLYFCSIHDFKPPICKNYRGNYKCYNAINDNKYYIILSDFQNVFLESDILIISTSRGELKINWRDYKDLLEEISSFLFYLKEYMTEAIAYTKHEY